MASLLDITKPHLAYYSIPAAFVLAVIPGTYRAFAAGKNFDVANPRSVVEKCEKDTTMDKRIVLRIQRATAASANGFESLGIYASGVVAAAAAGVPARTLNQLSAGYLASRALYNFVYVVLQDNRKFVPVRSVVWSVGVWIIVTLWVKAGNKLAA